MGQLPQGNALGCLLYICLYLDLELFLSPAQICTHTCMHPHIYTYTFYSNNYARMHIFPPGDAIWMRWWSLLWLR